MARVAETDLLAEFRRLDLKASNGQLVNYPEVRRWRVLYRRFYKSKKVLDQAISNSKTK
jgi:hypothetical protein